MVMMQLTRFNTKYTKEKPASFRSLARNYIISRKDQNTTKEIPARLEKETEPDDEDEFMSRMEKLHEERRQIMKDTCCSYGTCLRDDGFDMQPPAMNMYSHKYKVQMHNRIYDNYKYW